MKIDDILQWAEDYSSLTDEEFGMAMRYAIKGEACRSEDRAVIIACNALARQIDKERANAEGHRKSISLRWNTSNNTSYNTSYNTSNKSNTSYNNPNSPNNSSNLSNLSSSTPRDKEKEKEKVTQKEIDKRNNNIYRESVGGKTSLKHFIPPTAEEVAAYDRQYLANFLKKHGYTLKPIDAEHFVSYYEQGGWRLSNGNAMKNWQAAVVNWHKNEAERTKPRTAAMEIGKRIEKTADFGVEPSKIE